VRVDHREIHIEQATADPVVLDADVHGFAEVARGHHGEAEQAETADGFVAADQQAKCRIMQHSQAARDDRARLAVGNAHARIVDLLAGDAETGKPGFAGDAALRGEFGQLHQHVRRNVGSQGARIGFERRRRHPPHVMRFKCQF
jgi:hypothetical protein